MKKFTLTFMGVIIALFVIAQTASSSLDMGPKGPMQNGTKGTWTVQFNHNFVRSAAAGCETDGTHFYVTQWNSALIWKVNMSGVAVDSFSIAGVTGLRDLAYDGTYFYGGASANTIYKMDFSTTPPSLVSTIASPNVAVRNICYDPNADSGNGAFWVGNWSTDFSLVSRAGTVLSTIPAATHTLQSTYGTAYDTISLGGPYIWAISAGDPANTTIFQINASTGVLTGLKHDITTDVAAAGALGGGLWIQPELNSGTTTLGGLVQGTNIFGYDLATTALDTFDLAMDMLYIGSVTTIGQNVDIKGTISNQGLATITSFDLNYSINNGTTVTQSVSGVSIATAATYNFTHSTPWLSTAGAHDIKVWTSNPNSNLDANPGDDTLMTSVLAVNATYTKNVVYEEGTGTWCGWCVRGLVGLNTMAHTVTDGSWIGIGVHNGDPMAVTAYDNAIGNYIGGYPSGIINRKVDPVDPGLTTLQAAYSAEKLNPAVAKIEVTNKTYNAATRAWTVDVATTFGLDLTSADYNTALIIVENDVRGTASGYAQTNYYSGGTYGDMIDYDGTNYANLASPVPAADMVYNHVGRELVDGFGGSANSIPASITYNVPNAFSYSGTLSADYRSWYVSFVAIIIDNATGEILNATEVLLGNVGIEETVDSKYSIYPNPTNGIVTVEGPKDAQIIVYNMIGEVIFSNENSNENTTIDLSSFPAGNYMVRIISNDEVTTQKIVLTK